jgi:hypothetical protein
MQTNANGFGERLKGSLFKHGLILMNHPFKGDSLIQ